MMVAFVLLFVFQLLWFGATLAPEPEQSDSAAKDSGVEPLIKSDLEDRNSSMSHSESNSPCQSPNSGKFTDLYYLTKTAPYNS